MASVTTTITKAKIINNFRRNRYRFFDESVTGLPSDTLVKVPETATSVETAATVRIGQVTVVRKQIEVKTIIEDDSVGVKRIGSVTILGDLGSTHGTSDFKQGHNVKTLNQTACSMLPHLTINSPDIIDEFGNVINSYEETTFGQLYSYYFNVISDNIDSK